MALRQFGIRIVPSRFQRGSLRITFLAILVLAPVCVISSQEKEEEQLKVLFRVPKGMWGLPAIGGDGRKVIISPKWPPPEDLPAGLAEEWVLGKFDRPKLPQNAFICFPWAPPSVPFGTFKRAIDTRLAAVRIELPSIYYPANWEIPDAVARKLKFHPGSTYLLMFRVIPDKDFGTAYDPYFHLTIQMRKNIRDEAFDVQFWLPFLEPGDYEFGVRGGPHTRQVLRKRIRLDMQQGLRRFTEAQKWDELHGAGEKEPVKRFEEKDIIPWSIPSYEISAQEDE
jgi:hypothetical protein